MGHWFQNHIHTEVIMKMSLRWIHNEKTVESIGNVLYYIMNIHSSWILVDSDGSAYVQLLHVKTGWSRVCTRCWNFQGSLDEKIWTDLRGHMIDQIMCKPGLVCVMAHNVSLCFASLQSL